MTQRTDADAQDIEVKVGASALHLPVVRAVAVTLAMRADFDIDAISDIELAVDEACSELITRAAEDSTLHCRFTVGADDIGFIATVTSENRQPPSTASFGWRVLDTLTDTADCWVEPTGDSSFLVHITLAKRRQVTPG